MILSAGVEFDRLHFWLYTYTSLNEVYFCLYTICTVNLTLTFIPPMPFGTEGDKRSLTVTTSASSHGMSTVGRSSIKVLRHVIFGHPCFYLPCACRQNNGIHWSCGGIADIGDGKFHLSSDSVCHLPSFAVSTTIVAQEPQFNLQGEEIPDWASYWNMADASPIWQMLSHSASLSKEMMLPR